VRSIGFEEDSPLGGNPRLVQTFHASARTGETAMRIVPGDDRQGVWIEMVGVFVRQHHQAGLDFIGGDGCQGKPLETMLMQSAMKTKTTDFLSEQLIFTPSCSTAGYWVLPDFPAAVLA
jgi:hypothetical protein